MADAAAYRKLSHREHVLMRPAVYVGSADAEPVSVWLLEDKDKGDGGATTMARRDDVQYVPALLKIFDEIVINAIDHATRTRQRQLGGKGGTDKDKDKDVQVVKRIDVAIDRAAGGVISVSNDGDSIPVERHAEHDGVWVPELIFGHLLTSTNYDDEADGSSKRTIGGQNGIGAKACNILSRWFEVEVVDSARRLKYTQRFEDNMAVARAPVVVKSAARRSSLVVRFLPDYARLGMRDGALSDDMHALMVKRVYDATAVTDADVAVSLDGARIDVKSFERYVDMFVGGARAAATRAYERPANGWEVAAVLSDGTGLQQVSFVNGVATLRGGRHVDHVVQQLCRRVCELIAQRKKGLPPPKPQYVRDNLLVFVRATVPGATFDSQAKELLTTPVSRFGAKVELSDAFVDRLYKVEGLVERVVGLSGVAAEREARKTDGSKRASVSVPKLDDADWAGTPRSGQCTLILTEGDSAKASALAGLAVVGRQKYGVFPLRGKVMNVCDLSADRVAANAEISAVKKILGLQAGRAYATAAELRYGRVMLMTDADTDGSHIKGLVMNLFLQLWPSLLRVDGFLCSMLTPIVKVALGGGGGGGGGKDKDKSLEFYNLGDFEAWKAQQEALGAAAPKWSSKYYKGLGTSTSEEARDWFRRMRIVVYCWEDPPLLLPAKAADGSAAGAAELQPGGGGGGAAAPAATEAAPSSFESLRKAFDKKRADDRKAWLQGYDPARTLDYGSGDVTYTDFVERDLVHFSNYDVLRSIPSAIDGLKVSQRKALFGCRKRNLVRGEVRVAQLAAYVSEHACFHHGEASMQGTLVGMAQDFVGCGNNVPLLEPIGQFGTRLSGGDDWASPRYIHTRLTKAASLLFPRADDAVLEHLDDDGIAVEPRHYLPVVPLVLINGATGIGTGYSTSVPSYRPTEVVRAVRLRLEGHARDETLIALPWHRGFRGVIEATGAEGARKARARGVLVREGPTLVRVDELPVGYWTDDFKAALDLLVEKSPDMRSASNKSTDTAVRFEVTFASAAAADAWLMPSPSPSPSDISRLEAELKMATTKGLSTTNMHLFNARGQIRKYASPWDIVDEFVAERRAGYERRREHVLRRLGRELLVLRNRVLFVEAVLDGRLRLNVERVELDMEALGLARLLAPGSAGPAPVKIDDGAADADDGGGGSAVDAVDDGTSGSFGYLLSMPMASMTRARKDALDRQAAAKAAELAAAETRTALDEWRGDLDALEPLVA